MWTNEGYSSLLYKFLITTRRTHNLFVLFPSPTPQRRIKTITVPTMISDILEQFQVIRGSLAPLRLSRWQMTKMFAAHLNRDYPFVFKSFVLLWVAFVLWVLSVLTSPKRLEKKVKLPVLGGSRTLKHDFLKIIQEGKRLVSWFDAHFSFFSLWGG
jgi:hypothetical protein